MRRVLHAALVLLAGIPWLVGVAGFWISLWLGVLADRVWPGATWGNCWSYVLPRWRERGGYLLVRYADGMPVPHAAWVPKLPEGLVVRQTVPLRRHRGLLSIWRVFYFPFKVLRRERSRDATWIDSEPTDWTELKP